MKESKLHSKKYTGATPLDITAHSLGIVDRTSIAFLNEMLKNSLLFDKKHADYGPNNILCLGFVGVMQRAYEKLGRVDRLLRVSKRGIRAINEPLEDSLRDLSNYASIMLLLQLGKWPKAEASALQSNASKGHPRRKAKPSSSEAKSKSAHARKGSK